MRKLFPLLMLMLPGLLLAESNLDIANRYFSEDSPKLSFSDREALKIVKAWQKGSSHSKAFKAQDGAITFVYGEGQTKIVCSVLQTCDIALQPGEQFYDMQVADPRFAIEPSVTGSSQNPQIHLLVKPQDVGLDSSMVVSTNKRAYHLRLTSTRSDYMPYVSFVYPEDAKKKWQQVKKAQLLHKAENKFPGTHEYLGNLNFNYRVTGNARIKPLRVYNDGRKTIIEMPGAMQQTSAPALLVLKKRGLFKSPEKVMVNYRIHGCRYIIDNVFDSAILINGSGASQEKVTITRC